MPSSREANKVLAVKLAALLDKESLDKLLPTLEEKLYKNSYKKEDIEKYMFIVRKISLSEREDEGAPTLVIMIGSRSIRVWRVSSEWCMIVGLSTTQFKILSASCPT